MKRLPSSSAALLGLLLCGCSSSTNPTDGDAGPKCTATASGGTTSTFACGVGIAQDPHSTVVNINDSANSTLSILLQFSGGPARTSYSGATVIGALADLKSSDGSREWEQKSDGGSDSEGSFTFTLSDTGPATDLGAGSKIYRNAHGTYVGTFTAKSGAAGGTVTLNITF
jgi:hypothetical protein